MYSGIDEELVKVSRHVLYGQQRIYLQKPRQKLIIRDLVGLVVGCFSCRAYGRSSICMNPVLLSAFGAHPAAFYARLAGSSCGTCMCYLQLKAWLKALPTAKRPLVKTNVKMASDAAIQHLIASVGALGPRTSASTIQELENVDERLLLPPFDPTAPLSTLVGGHLEPGDRIVSLRSAGVPAFGLRGTVVTVFEQAVEVIMDEDFPGK